MSLILADESLRWKTIWCPLATDAIWLEESVVDKDVLTYVLAQLQHDGRLSKWSIEVGDVIETALLSGAQGMSSWVGCQIGLLRKALRILPKTLDETYASILDKIPNQHFEDARGILGYLICAFHLLAIEEIAETVAIVCEGKPYYDVENRLQESRNILTICSGLVSITNNRRERYGKVTNLKGPRLSHFLRQRVSNIGAHCSSSNVEVRP